MNIHPASRQTVEQYFKDNAFDMLAPSDEVFPYEYLDPGKQYRGSLWDWDSFFSVKALIHICEYFRSDPSFPYEERKAAVIRGGMGCVKNFLSYQFPDGYIPIVLWKPDIESHYTRTIHQEKNILNQHKPFLCQSVRQISLYADDISWFDPEPLIRYIDYYKREQYNERVGLFFFKSDYMIGIDNNPTVFGFPYESTGDFYLNAFMYLELQALTELLTMKHDERAAVYKEDADRLLQAIREECYDRKDGLYYSVFLDLDSTRQADLGWHTGMQMRWKTLPIRIRTAITFLSLYAGIATPSQAERMVREHLSDPKFLSPHGLRSTACDEKVYSLEATSNPSNSLGPVWMIYNYLAFVGLMKYGYRDLAGRLCHDMVELFAHDIRVNGKTDECYHPETGEPIMNQSFLSWNSLIIPMLHEWKNTPASSESSQ